MDPNSSPYTYQDSGTYQEKNKLPILILVAVLILIVVGGLIAYTIYVGRQFRVVSTNPALNNVATLTPFLQIQFNRSLSNKGLVVSSTNNIIRADTISGDTLTIDLDGPLQANRQYAVTIGNIASRNGALITNKTLTFVPADTAFNSLPKDQQQKIINSQDKYSAAQRDPILSYLPYSTLDFSLSATFPTGNNGQPQLVLQAQLLLPPGVSGTEETNDINQYKQEVLNYINSLGLDPAKYTIQYQTVSESLTGV